jgi:hypothetical protein
MVSIEGIIAESCLLTEPHSLNIVQLFIEYHSVNERKKPIMNRDWSIMGCCGLL